MNPSSAFFKHNFSLEKKFKTFNYDISGNDSQKYTLHIFWETHAHGIRYTFAPATIIRHLNFEICLKTFIKKCN